MFSMFFRAKSASLRFWRRKKKGDQFRNGCVDLRPDRPQKKKKIQKWITIYHSQKWDGCCPPFSPRHTISRLLLLLISVPADSLSFFCFFDVFFFRAYVPEKPFVVSLCAEEKRVFPGPLVQLEAPAARPLLVREKLFSWKYVLSVSYLFVFFLENWYSYCEYLLSRVFFSSAVFCFLLFFFATWSGDSRVGFPRV